MILFPQPRIMQQFDGVYTLPGFDADSTLVSFFHRLQAGEEGAVITQNALLAKEEYHLDVDAGGIKIAVSSDEGPFRAATSLHQMLRRGNGTLPFIHIEASP